MATLYPACTFGESEDLFADAQNLNFSVRNEIQQLTHLRDSLTIADYQRLAWLMNHDRMRCWFTFTGSLVLFVADVRAMQRHTPLTYFCAIFSQGLEMFNNTLILTYFCGPLANPAEAGNQLTISLLGQLIAKLLVKTHLSSFPPGEVWEIFVNLIILTCLKGHTVFILLDNISWFAASRYIGGLSVIEALQDLVRNMGTGTLKLLMTSSSITSNIRASIRDHEYIAIPGTVLGGEQCTFEPRMQEWLQCMKSQWAAASTTSESLPPLQLRGSRNSSVADSSYNEGFRPEDNLDRALYFRDAGHSFGDKNTMSTVSSSKDSNLGHEVDGIVLLGIEGGKLSILSDEELGSDRCSATYHCMGDVILHVWVDWKDYQWQDAAPSPQHSQRKKSVQELLKQPHPHLPCLIRQVDDTILYRFGLIFKFAEWSPAQPCGSLMTLLEIFSRPTPPDKFRISFAHALVNLIADLHKRPLYHGDLRSHNIIFYDYPSYDSYPLFHLSGFELQHIRTDADCIYPNDIGDNIYRHPDDQGMHEVDRLSSKFDAYSLGVVLVEIAHWKKIDDILAISMRTDRKATQAIRERLLADSQLNDLKCTMGDAYAEVVRGCLDEGFISALV